MFNLLSIIFKYIFIAIIYLFIYSIIKLIYLDIRGLSFISTDDGTYLKLLNDIESIPYLIKEYYLLNRDISIGRGFNNEIVIENPYVSKKHLLIKNDEGKYVAEDLNSSNGSYINGKKLLGSVYLESGDIIQIGDLQFEFIDR